MALTPFQRSTALGAVVLLLSLVQVTYSISCLYCGEDGKEQLSQCNEITECKENHTCYIEQFMSEQHDFQARYRAGCRDIHDCNLIRCYTESFRNTSLVTKHLRHHSKRDDLVICTECCYSDTCNVQGCGAIFSDSAAKQCFHCSMLRSYSPICDTFKQCVTDTMNCATILHVHDNGIPYFELKCLEEKFCDILQELAEHSHIQPTTRCCDKHLCNQNPFKTSNTTHTHYLACPTGLVKPPTTTTITTTTAAATTTTTTTTTRATTTPTLPPPTTTPTTTTTTKPETTTTTTTPATTATTTPKLTPTTTTTSTTTTRPATTTTTTRATQKFSTTPTSQTSSAPHVLCISCSNAPLDMTGCTTTYCDAKTQWCYTSVHDGAVSAGCLPKLACYKPAVVGRRGRSTGCWECCDPGAQCLCNGRYCGLSNYVVASLAAKANCFV